MKMQRILMTVLGSMTALVLMAADYTVSGQYVTIPVKDVKAGCPRVVRLQVVGDNIIRVQAHRITDLFAVEEPYRQCLHPIEELLSHLLESSLRDRCHHPVESER